MGNEQSLLSRMDIEDEAIEVSNFWSHHSATINDSSNVNNLTVFVEDSTQYANDSLWSPQTPLEKCTKVGNQNCICILNQPYICNEF